MRDILVAAGSNLPSGEISPLEVARSARVSLEEKGWRVPRTSSFYRNPAWPPDSNAPDYVNAVFEIEGFGTPEELLADLHAIEAETGRTRGARYLSRTLDLDLLAWGDIVLPAVATARRWLEAEGAARADMPHRLIVPHPRMHERAFVLVPLAEIAPAWLHPILRMTAAELRDALPADEVAQLKPV